MPWPHPTLYLAYEVGLNPAEMGTTCKMRVAIQDQDGKSLFTGEGEMPTKGPIGINEEPTIKQVLCINGLNFERIGPHQIVIWLQDEVRHTLRFEVAPPPNAAQASNA